MAPSNLPINSVSASSAPQRGGTPPSEATGGGADSQAVRREQTSFYDQIGGAETFRKITAKFYEQVAADPVMSEMYPEEDLGPAEERLRMFLEQYWGGPTTYSDTRGHPRLRMRHQPYAVTPEARDTWLKYMRVALKEANLSPLHEATFWDYLERAAHSLVNTF